MGMYLNPGIGRYAEAVRSRIFVDKTPMIRHLNAMVHAHQKCLCVSRPRRFGKTMVADMLCAYYGRGDGVREMFGTLKLAKDSGPEGDACHGTRT